MTTGSTTSWWKSCSILRSRHAAWTGDGRRRRRTAAGPWGYQDLLQALADPKHEEHEDRVEWVGEGYDPELVDIQAIDGALRRLS